MTREEAIKVLTNLQNGHGVSYSEDYGLCFGHKWMQAYEMAIAALREQESAENAHCNSCKKCNSWIPVEEALPPDQSDVLVVALWNGEWQTMTGWLSCVTHEWRCVTPYGEHKPEKVVSWMPLPNPEVEV